MASYVLSTGGAGVAGSRVADAMHERLDGCRRAVALA